MAYRTTEGQAFPKRVFEAADANVIATKRAVTSVRDKLVVGTATTHDVREGVWNTLAINREALAEAAATPGIAAYAKWFFRDANYDVAVDFTAMLAALDAVLSWLAANYPRDGQGRIIGDRVSLAGTPEPIPTADAFAQPEIDALVAAIDGFLAAID